MNNPAEKSTNKQKETALNCRITLLGQSGCRIEYSETVIYVDPYLSNSVQELDASDLTRLVPIPVRPEEVTDADWVLITHDHIDHCDPHTLPGIARASRHARFIGPVRVLDKLKKWGVAPARLKLAKEEWTVLSPDLNLHTIPAAHPSIEYDANGNLLYVGYLLEAKGKRIYIAGDTSVTQKLIDTLKLHKPISTAILPVNEQNFFRARRGIIGNMSVREAFGLADELEINTLIPVHWDMFDINSAYIDEIRSIYQHMKPAFKLDLCPQTIDL